MNKSRNKVFLIALTVIIVIVSCKNQTSGLSKASENHSNSTYTIEGNIKGVTEGWIQLVTYEQTEKIREDSAEIKNGIFKFSGTAGNPPQKLLFGFTNSWNLQRGMLFLEPGTVRVSAHKDSLRYAMVSGTPLNDESDLYRLMLKPFTDQTDFLEQKYYMARANGNKVMMDSVQAVAKSVYRDQVKMEKAYIKTHPASYLAASKIPDFYEIYPAPGEIDSIYQALDPKIKETALGKSIAIIAETAVRTKLGKPAPDFSMDDTSGKKVGLADYKGKYLLIDFWASWCVPCRAENPNLIKAYATYHKRGLEIISISLDDQREKWLDAIKQDRLTWAQISELKVWRNTGSNPFGVLSIPMNFLIDKNGIIIAKDLRGAELSKKLAAIL